MPKPTEKPRLRLGFFVSLLIGRHRRRRRQIRARFVHVGSALHLPYERLRGILNLAYDPAGLAHDGRKLLFAENQQRQYAQNRHIGQGQHPLPLRGGGSRALLRARARMVGLKIIYTRGNRTETLASLATLRKILNRFVAHRVFYEVSSRNKRGHEFFSAKNVFVVGSIEVVNRDYLTITIFDANNQSHSIEILNPATMRIYDEMPGKGFAVSFISDGESGVESRCYLRDEGEDGDGNLKQSALEKITLPQLFEYLEEITSADLVK